MSHGELALSCRCSRPDPARSRPAEAGARGAGAGRDVANPSEQLPNGRRALTWPFPIILPLQSRILSSPCSGAGLPGARGPTARQPPRSSGSAPRGAGVPCVGRTASERPESGKTWSRKRKLPANFSAELQCPGGDAAFGGPRFLRGLGPLLSGSSDCFYKLAEHSKNRFKIE